MKIINVFLLLFIPFLSHAQKSASNKYLDSLLTQLPKAAEDTSKVMLLDKISYTYIDIDPEKGINYALQTRELAEKLGWKKGIAHAYAELGGNYKSKADLIKSTYYYLNARNLFQEIGRPKSVAAVQANLSVVYLEQGDYNEALKHAFESLKIKESLNDTRSMGIVQENIGTIYLELKNYSKTMEFYRRALKTYKETGNLVGEARCLGNIALVYEVRGEHINALNFHLKSLELKQKTGDKYAISVSYSNIGNVNTVRKHYDEALQYHKKALDITLEIGNKSAVALNYGNIGETYFMLAKENTFSQYNTPLIPATAEENLQLAVKYLTYAVEICKETNFNRPLLQFSENLFRAHMLRGDKEQSMLVFDQYIKLKDSVFSQQNLQQLATQEAKRELELKDKDLEIKDKKLEIASLKAENASKQRQILLAGIIILIFIASIIYMKFRNRIKQQDSTLDDISQMQSHYVRGPVARILGLVQLFNDKEISDPINKEVITHLKTSTNQLDEVVKKLIIKTEF